MDILRANRGANPKLESASAAATILNQGFDFGTGSWAAQEFVKGSTYLIPGLVQSGDQGGWRFHYNPHASSGWEQGYWKEVLVPDNPNFARKYSPEEARDEILDEFLRRKPFFRPFRERNLFDPVLGSIQASDLRVQYDVLARGVPAQSYSIAANPHPRFKANYNMPDFKTLASSWPEKGHSGEKRDKWLHNDFKNVAFNYLYKMYQQMVDLGELDQ